MKFAHKYIKVAVLGMLIIPLFVTTLSVVVAPSLAVAATPSQAALEPSGPNDVKRYSDGGFSLVQCDGVVSKPGEVKCDFAALIAQIKFLINWMFYIAIPITIGVFAYAGALLMSHDPKNISKARAMFPPIIKGFIFMLLAWLIVHTIILWIAQPGFGTQLLQM